MHVSHLSRRPFIEAAALAAGGLVLGEGLVGCADVRELGGYVLTEGSQTDRGFVVDDALQTPSGRTLHFSLHVPDSYDGSAPYALYVACPGWEGLYFQGVGANLQEDYPFVANDYIADMIVASPQLDAWDEQSASDVVGLTEWLLGAYSIDADHVYLSGCSGGGETISIVLGTRPELYRRALHTISRWDGDIETLTTAEVPVYMAIGENDDYYGSGPAREAYEEIRAAYRARRLSRSASASWSCSMSSPRATSPSGALLRTRASTERAATSLPVTRTSWDGCSHDAENKGTDEKGAAPHGRHSPCDPACGSDVFAFLGALLMQVVVRSARPIIR